ncbi:Major allergen Asp f 2 [Cladophialophora carrionii]|uniref:Major allergen Asp f 2 n=1 Tax=Cladophialophora carrionii TaxID=86049 RepID=A0A1C1CIK2_9EURO|nr:Major allergen Asp f 2 [Cladophialophora carrionii]
MAAVTTMLLTILFLTTVVPTSALPLQARQSDDLAPLQSATAWRAGAVTEFQIHASCNASQAHQLRAALAETVDLARHAKEHVLRWGNSSEHYQKYFGDAPSGEVVGYLDKIVSGDRGSSLFRCDNPDGNCDLEGYGGHWRGENATDETVICPLSYETRRSLTQMCALGYNVAESETNTFWASDLMHRLYHLPAFGEDHIGHYSEDYQGVLELAEHNSTFSTRDSDALQYFALEVYAYDIAVPGVGCPGPENTTADEGATPTQEPASASTTTSAAEDCHLNS